MTLGCSSWAVICASSTNRATSGVGSSSREREVTLIASSRRSFVSMPRKTEPTAPRPTSSLGWIRPPQSGDGVAGAGDADSSSGAGVASLGGLDHAAGRTETGVGLAGGKDGDGGGGRTGNLLWGSPTISFWLRPAPHRSISRGGPEPPTAPPGRALQGLLVERAPHCRGGGYSFVTSSEAASAATSQRPSE